MGKMTVEKSGICHRVVQMRLTYLIVILFLLASSAAAQLAPDKERFDVVIHPGEVEEKTLKVTNVGDESISKISSTSVSGTAKDFIFLGIPEAKEGKALLQPQDKAEIKIFFAIPPETKPGSYTGFIYLLDSSPPSMPIAIEFNVDVIGVGSYGVGMTINDARSSSIFAKADETAQFDLAVKNLGTFRDVASINTSALPEGWTVTLVDGEKEQSLPYELSLQPGVTHIMKLQIQSSQPGKESKMRITATSLGNSTKNATVEAQVDFGMAIRGYNVDIEVPERMVANKTYKGSFAVMLDVREKVLVGVVTPQDLMVIPLAQVVDVTPDNPGNASFSMLASKPGEYPLVFKLIDSNGIPMPEEVTTVKVVQPEGVAVLTGDDFLYSTVASLAAQDNRTVPVITVPRGKLSENDLEQLQGYARIVILGNESIVSGDAEKELIGTETKRIEGGSLCETCWRFVAELRQNGISRVVLSTTKPSDVFRAYRYATINGLPVVICDGDPNSATLSVIENLTKRNVTLSKVLTMGEVGEGTAKALAGMNISMEAAE